MSTREIIVDPRNQIFVSAASVWEIAIKRALGKLRFNENVAETVEEAGFSALPVTLFHAEQAGALPPYHRDPFDRMLVAQAQAEGSCHRHPGRQHPALRRTFDQGWIGGSPRGRSSYAHVIPAERFDAEMTLRTLALAIEEHVATVTLDRPAAGNSVNELMASELRETCESVDADPDVRVVLLTGRGDAFCLGTDGPGPVDGLRAAAAVAAVRKPVIAVLNGDAVDQGLEIALACDIRIASTCARLGLTHLARGAIPWDGGTQRLPRLVGIGRAMDMLLTSRLLDAGEALEAGLVNELAEAADLRTRARALAGTVAGQGPIAARYLKEALLKGADMTLEQGLRLEADLNIILQSTADRAEGIRSFLERRSPLYRNE